MREVPQCPFLVGRDRFEVAKHVRSFEFGELFSFFPEVLECFLGCLNQAILSLPLRLGEVVQDCFSSLELPNGFKGETFFIKKPVRLQAMLYP